MTEEPPVEQLLALEMVRVTEAAAIESERGSAMASARTFGDGGSRAAPAVGVMRYVLARATASVVRS